MEVEKYQLEDGSGGWAVERPATIKNTTIAFSQSCSDTPSIDLNLFEKVALGAVALLVAGFISLVGFVIVGWWR